MQSLENHKIKAFSDTRSVQQFSYIALIIMQHGDMEEKADADFSSGI